VMETEVEFKNVNCQECRLGPLRRVLPRSR
jgi:hypothetical protein